MPPRPNSPRISFLLALVSVTILFPRTDVRRLTSTFSPIPAEVNPPSELVFRSRHGRSSSSVSLVLRDQLRISHVAGHLPCAPFHLSEWRVYQALKNWSALLSGRGLPDANASEHGSQRN